MASLAMPFDASVDMAAQQAYARLVATLGGGSENAGMGVRVTGGGGGGARSATGALVFVFLFGLLTLFHDSKQPKNSSRESSSSSRSSSARRARR